MVVFETLDNLGPQQPSFQLQGMIVAERYAETLGFFNSTPLLGWSLGKSLTAALTGMRIADGELADVLSPSFEPHAHPLLF